MTTIISKGTLVAAHKSYPLPSGTRTWRGPTGGDIPLLRQELHLTYEGMYRTQPWVFAVVNKLAYGIARLPLKAYEMNADGGRDRARGTGLDTLLRKPRPLTAPFQRKLDLCGSLFIHGHALEVKFRKEGPGSPPTELWMVPWKYVQTVEDDSGIVGYNILQGGKTTALAPSEVVHYSLLGGVSPLEPLRRTLALEDAAIEWQGSSLKNGVTPRGVLTTDKTVSEKEKERATTVLGQMFGGVENAGRVGILSGGFTWAKMGESAVDAELINQRKLSREEVCGAYDIAPPLVGILDRATFNNIEVLKEGLYVDSLGPKATLIEETQQAQLIDPELSWDGLFSEFDFNDVLRPSAEARMRSYLMAQQSSTTTVNDRRRAENLKPIDHPLADTVLIPSNMIALGEQAPATPAPATASLADHLALQAFLGGKVVEQQPLEGEDVT